jgi:putative FmdB family regulatory protein
MPTYEYACQACGHHVEVYQRFTDDALTVCEVCGGPLRKVFHPAGILFKGSGFYATDSRKGSKSSSDSESSSSSKKSDSKSDSSSRSKSDSSSGSSSSSSSSSSSKEGASSSPSTSSTSSKKDRS